MNRIKALDSCRGLAASIVVFQHIFTRFGDLFIGLRQTKIYDLLAFISSLNVVAVLFFFLLSGFSIRLSLKNGMPVDRPLLNEYLYKRFKRILPLYVVALVFTFACGIAIHDINKADYGARNLLGNLLFLQTPQAYKGYWFSPFGENGPLWSLSFEMFYYLFFPPFIYCMMRVLAKRQLSLRDQRIILCVAFVLSVVCVVLNNKIFIPYIAFSKLFFVWYSGFFLGNLYTEKKMKFDINFLLIAVILVLSGMLSYLKKSDSLGELFVGVGISIAFFSSCILLKKLPAHFLAKAERSFNFLFFRIGKGSYALYLLHFPVILVLKSFANVNIWMVVLSMILLTYTSIRLEEFFTKKKLRVFRLQYI